MDERVGDFLDAIASERAAPAGGSGAAVSAAIGTALCEMAVVHADDDTTDRAALRDARTQLLDLAETDARVVDSVFSSRSEPLADTDYRQAVDVPRSIARVTLSVLERATSLLGTDDANTTPDVITGCLLIGAACEASCATVLANCDAMDESTTDIERDVRHLRAEAVSYLDSVRLQAGLEAV